MARKRSNRDLTRIGERSGNRSYRGGPRCRPCAGVSEREGCEEKAARFLLCYNLGGEWVPNEADPTGASGVGSPLRVPGTVRNEQRHGYETFSLRQSCSSLHL